MSALLDAALSYAAQGRPVFPLQWAVDGKCSCQRGDCSSPAKHPRTEHGLSDATVDVAAITKWWGEQPQANIGLVMGDGLLAIDIDPRSGGDESVANLGDLPDTVTALTGGGGCHLIYHVDEDYGNGAGIAPGVDVRSKGGYIVAPPSVHASGRRYEWEVGCAPGDLKPAPLPDVFKRLMQNGQRAPEVSEIIPSGERNSTLASLAGTMRRRGFGEAEIAAALLVANTGRCDPPLSNRDVLAIAASVARYPASKPKRERPAGGNIHIPDSQFGVHENEDAPPKAPVLVRLSDVTPRQVQWLWPGRIPLGKISIIAGDPGLMKSMLSLDIAARTSRGSPWPDGGIAPQGDVLLLTAEDDLDDTVRPRLDTLGADVNRITALTMIWTAEGEVAFNLHDHLPLLEQALTPETRLIIIDPVLAFTGGTDTHVSAQVRGVLAPLQRLAGETKVSVLGIIHLNKKLAGNAFQRILASIDFSAAPRSVLLVGEDADDSTLRHFAVVKNNLAAPAETLTYRWSDGQGFTWAGKSDLTAHQLLAAPADGEGRTALVEAKEILTDLLSSGPVSPTEIRKAATAAGVKEATLRGAKDALGVRSVKSGFGADGQWKWELPALRRGENTDPTLDGSDTEHQESAPPMESPDDGPDSCLTCGAEATYYAPNGKPFCDEHRLDRSWETS